MPSIRIESACKSCGATGLYVGMAERDGIAVVCLACEGSGKSVFVHDYEDFTGRKKREGVTHVLAANPGICAAPGVTDGGVPYPEWLNGADPKALGLEMRSHTCPAWWYQSADYDKKPKWDECIVIGSFSNCDNFPDKAKCWERFDKEAE